jgi:hypothetical protein
VRKLISSGCGGLNNKAKVTVRKSYGFRTYRVLELALYHSLGKLREPESTNDFFSRINITGHILGNSVDSIAAFLPAPSIRSVYRDELKVFSSKTLCWHGRSPLTRNHSPAETGLDSPEFLLFPAD